MVFRVMSWALVCLLIAAVIPASMGIVIVPVMVTTASTSNAADDDAFPCKGMACGCAGSESCKMHCCCHGPSAVPAGNKATNPSDSSNNKHVSLLEARTASCAGSGVTVSFEDVGWQAPVGTHIEMNLPLVCLESIAHISVPDGMAIPVTPPPPRFGSIA